MKNILIAVCICFGVLHARAQQAIGLYLTQNDFAANTLSYQVNTPGNTGKIKWNYLFNAGKIKVVHNDTKHLLDKKAVYGFADSKGRHYRFVNDIAYRVLDTAGFCMYEHLERPAGKGYQAPVVKHYFSTGTADAIQPLTIHNLKRAFPENTTFRYWLDAGFKSDKELLAYDSFEKMYKLKYIYLRSGENSVSR